MTLSWERPGHRRTDNLSDRPRDRWALAGLVAGFLVVALLALSGCGTVPGVSHQGKLGVTYATLDYDAETGDVSATAWDGKDKQDVDLTVETPKGTKVTYSVGESRATEPARNRTEVEKVIAEQFAIFGVDAVNAIADVVMTYLNPVGSTLGENLSDDVVPDS